MPKSFQWVHFYQIWYRGSPRGRNQLWWIFFRLVQGYWYCRGLKFAYPHRNWRSPLTLAELPFRLWQAPVLHWNSPAVYIRHYDFVQSVPVSDTCASDNFNSLQLTYRHHFCTETALRCTLNSMIYYSSDHKSTADLHYLCLATEVQRLIQLITVSC